MSYIPQTWSDGSAGGTPVSATRLNHMEAGIVDAGRSGSGLSAELVGDHLVVTVTSNWGVPDVGNPYYDPAGATPDDASIASLDVDGHLVLTKPSGG